MDRLEALRIAETAVTDGLILQAKDFVPVFGSSSISGHLNRSADLVAWQAYNGSLDAAKALHEALLPGAWMWKREWDGEWSLDPIDPRQAEKTERVRVYEEDVRGGEDKPARAWLLAIIRALIAQQEADHD